MKFSKKLKILKYGFGAATVGLIASSIYNSTNLLLAMGSGMMCLDCNYNLDRLNNPNKYDRDGHIKSDYVSPRKLKKLEKKKEKGDLERII